MLNDECRMLNYGVADYFNVFFNDTLYLLVYFQNLV